MRYIVEVEEDKTTWMDWNWNIHREDDLPAIEWKDGCKVWYKNGLKHRNGNPAVVFPDGHEEWWLNGVLHREGGLPAIKTVEGRQFYYEQGTEYFPNE